MNLYDDMYGELHCYGLPIVVLKDNYILHGENYNHEEYLVDFINHSRLVQDKGGIFQHQESQSNSERDAINDIGYGIDFKRFSGSSQMHAKAETSEDIHKTNRLIAYSVSKCNETKSYCDMFKSIHINPSILTSRFKTNDDKLLNDIRTIKKLLTTKKNLMIFFPCEFEFCKVDTDETVAKQIVSLLHETLYTMKRFRCSQVDGFERKRQIEHILK